MQGNTVVFRGADVVDGTPVLDIKPYIPFVDGVITATAPDWVSHTYAVRQLSSDCNTLYHCSWHHIKGMLDSQIVGCMWLLCVAELSTDIVIC